MDNRAGARGGFGMKWRFHDASRFADLAPAWRELHAAGSASPLLHADFVQALLDAFGDGDELLACCERDDVVLAMTLLARRGGGAWSSFQPAQAPIGLWLARPGVALDGLMASLLRDLPGCALLAGISQLDPMLDPRPRHDPHLATLDYIDTARITLGGDFDAYWEERGKNLRGNLKKQRARLAREGVAVRIEACHAEPDMTRAVDDYALLESGGWKGRAATAVRGGDAQARFYRALLEAFARRGAARVYRYWFDERLAAMDLCIDGPDCCVVLKTAYDEAIPAHYSPALLMREEACRALFAEPGLARIEFYGRVMEWHLRWTNEVRCLYHLNYYRWPMLKRLHALGRRRGGAEQAQPPMEQSCISKK